MNSKVAKGDEFSKAEISQAVKDYCEAKNISQRELATKCQVSDATINHIVNGKWEAISEAMWRKVGNVVSEGRSQIMFDTNDHALITKVCKEARAQRLMIGLTGDTGMGKTTSLKLIARQKNTYYVAYDKTMKARQFFSAVLKEMGISFEGNLHDMVNMIAEEMNTASKPLLIIDEAGKLTHNVMLYLHVLRDKTMNNSGIVLSGMPYFETNLRKNSNRQKEGFAEFLRRVNVWQALHGLSRNEIKAICTEHGITDPEEQREFFAHKRFGDLSNALQLHRIQLISSLLNE